MDSKRNGAGTPANLSPPSVALHLDAINEWKTHRDGLSVGFRRKIAPMLDRFDDVAVERSIPTAHDRDFRDAALGGDAHVEQHGVRVAVVRVLRHHARDVVALGIAEQPWTQWLGFRRAGRVRLAERTGNHRLL